MWGKPRRGVGVLQLEGVTARERVGAAEPAAPYVALLPDGRVACARCRVHEGRGPQSETHRVDPEYGSTLSLL